MSQRVMCVCWREGGVGVRRETTFMETHYKCHTNRKLFCIQQTYGVVAAALEDFIFYTIHSFSACSTADVCVCVCVCVCMCARTCVCACVHVGVPL